jgi:hypothetical protein
VAHITDLTRTPTHQSYVWSVACLFLDWIPTAISQALLNDASANSDVGAEYISWLVEPVDRGLKGQAKAHFLSLAEHVRGNCFYSIRPKCVSYTEGYRCTSRPDRAGSRRRSYRLVSNSPEVLRSRDASSLLLLLSLREPNGSTWGV